MPPNHAAEAEAPLRKQALLVLWPAFVMAGVLEMLVFAVVDPGSLHGLDAEPIGWSRSAVYSVSFFVFWLVIAAATAVTRWLERPGRA